MIKDNFMKKLDEKGLLDYIVTSISYNHIGETTSDRVVDVRPYNSNAAHMTLEDGRKFTIMVMEQE